MSRRVLIIERDNALRSMVADHTRLLGFDVETSEELQEAMERASLSRFDVVITKDATVRPRLIEVLGSSRPPPALVVIGKDLPSELAHAADQVLTAPLSRPALANAVLEVARTQSLAFVSRAAPQTTKKSRPKKKKPKQKKPGGTSFQIGRYEVLSFLGHGSLGGVLECHEPAQSERYAVKVIPRELVERVGRGRQWLDRFRRAIGAAASLSHPNVLRVVDYGLDEETFSAYVVTELAAGQTLLRRIEQDGPLAAGELLSIGYSMAMALDHAHRNQILHRRLGSSKVFVEHGGLCRIGGFGVAAALCWDLFPLDEKTTRDTPAPEQIRLGRAGPETDQFAWGVTMYEAATGRPCFGGKSTAEKAHAILSHHPDDPGGLPEGLFAIINRALDKTPTARHPSMTELAREVAACGQKLGLHLEAEEDR